MDLSPAPREFKQTMNISSSPYKYKDKRFTYDAVKSRNPMGSPRSNGSGGKMRSPGKLKPLDRIRVIDEDASLGSSQSSASKGNGDSMDVLVHLGGNGNSNSNSNPVKRLPGLQMKTFHSCLLEDEGMYPHSVLVLLMADRRDKLADFVKDKDSYIFPSDMPFFKGNQNKDEWEGEDDTASDISGESLMSMTSINITTNRLMVKTIDTINGDESFFVVQLREFSMFFDKLMNKYEGMSTKFFNPSDYKWWADNIPRIIMLKQKAKAQGHVHLANCTCTNIFMKVSKTLIEKNVVADLRASYEVHNRQEEEKRSKLREEGQRKKEEFEKEQLFWDNYNELTGGALAAKHRLQDLQAAVQRRANITKQLNKGENDDMLAIPPTFSKGRLYVLAAMYQRKEMLSVNSVVPAGVLSPQLRLTLGDYTYTSSAAEGSDSVVFEWSTDGCTTMCEAEVFDQTKKYLFIELIESTNGKTLGSATLVLNPLVNTFSLQNDPMEVYALVKSLSGVDYGMVTILADVEPVPLEGKGSSSSSLSQERKLNMKPGQDPEAIREDIERNMGQFLAGQRKGLVVVEDVTIVECKDILGSKTHCVSFMFESLQYSTSRQEASASPPFPNPKHPRCAWADTNFRFVGDLQAMESELHCVWANEAGQMDGLEMGMGEGYGGGDGDGEGEGGGNSVPRIVYGSFSTPLIALCSPSNILATKDGSFLCHLDIIGTRDTGYQGRGDFSSSELEEVRIGRIEVKGMFLPSVSEQDILQYEVGKQVAVAARSEAMRSRKKRAEYESQLANDLELAGNALKEETDAHIREKKALEEAQHALLKKEKDLVKALTIEREENMKAEKWRLRELEREYEKEMQKRKMLEQRSGAPS